VRTEAAWMPACSQEFVEVIRNASDNDSR